MYSLIHFPLLIHQLSTSYSLHSPQTHSPFQLNSSPPLSLRYLVLKFIPHCSSTVPHRSTPLYPSPWPLPTAAVVALEHQAWTALGRLSHVPATGATKTICPMETTRRISLLKYYLKY